MNIRKAAFIFFAFSCLAGRTFAQVDDPFANFDDDDLFFADGDGFDILDEADVTAQSDLSKGVLFDNGSIKIGGSFSTSIATSTILYADDDKDFGDHFKATTLTPTLSTNLSVDARPTQNLRMYTKFGFAYPFVSKGTASFDYSQIEEAEQMKQIAQMYGMDYNPSINGTVSITDWLKLKEVFTDFSIADTAFFRFGLHTVTWGAGYFFSPVSDIINTSSINPEDTSAQVDGSLNLRTQITIPNTQDCLWFYIIPSTDFRNDYTAESYARDTALAGKADLVFGGWEIGVGGYYKYHNAPKATLTATGSLKKISFFGEAVYQYGAASEWTESSKWEDKANIFQGTAGFSRMWSNQNILLAAQYYYDGNKKDMAHQYITYGHNIAAMANFGRILGSSDLTASVFGMVNFGKEDMPELYKQALAGYGISSYLNTATFSAMLNFSPVTEMKIGMGPYITFESWDKQPDVALKLSFTLGGGSF